MRVLNVEVPEGLLEQWVQWFAPSRQPFLADPELAASLAVPLDEAELPPELRDTFAVYETPPGLGFAWLDEAAFDALPRTARSGLVRAQRRFGREHVPSVRTWAPVVGDRARRQADGYRFVWWPSALVGLEQQVLTAYVEEGRRPSRHDEVPAAVWRRASEVLPAAQELAGRFPQGSGPNCFGTVMAAAAVPGAATTWMQRAPFEQWLERSTARGGRDDDPGTVLVWRSGDGLVQHAAVTIGDGWAQHKPSQNWFDPVKVLSVSDLKRRVRSVGRRLQRRTLLT